MLSGQGPASRRTRRAATTHVSRDIRNRDTRVLRDPRGTRETVLLDRSAGRPSARVNVRARTDAKAEPPPRSRRTRAPRRPRRLSARAIVLGLVLVALALAYAYPVRVLLSQQAQIASILNAQDEQRARIAALNNELAKWADDEYVRVQARRRFFYVRPGEVAYVIVESPGGVAAGATGRGGAGGGPWFSQLWSSIQAADDPRTPQQ
jgi:cell division protein FtsB